MENNIAQASEAIANADALLIAAGAGMGVDSGLPDFRGTEGFWKAYPHAERLGLRFEELANPRWFREDPDLAWGFYGQRAKLYTNTQAHDGFQILRSWAAEKAGGSFVFTSNVDGHFAQAGFNENAIVECHGSLSHLQCVEECTNEIWDFDESAIPEVDPETFRAGSPLPSCPHCGGLARPNILMFGDTDWHPARSARQEARLQNWYGELRKTNQTIAVIELGAGTAVPSVRRFTESFSFAMSNDTPLVRINIRESEGDGIHDRVIPVALGALEALEALEALQQMRS